MLYGTDSGSTVVDGASDYCVGFVLYSRQSFSFPDPEDIDDEETSVAPIDPWLAQITAQPRPSAILDAIDDSDSEVGISNESSVGSMGRPRLATPGSKDVVMPAWDAEHIMMDVLEYYAEQVCSHFKV